mmetsp:Transcript_57826/g.122999  ORF Transcript_57826/g.122999 Transcript_57826/m.122999 type:complete len:425 (+) Transcript_57826:200-1474(+)|eukprot:CAMPEP_0206422352 /NCGR_PEP_ID=MMETSP0324_2-20121206/2021_1 /ASSEMBLY_ACC=CAM_ASM_000836 /TAXON_ID=2866 /ORGANISM="Crypthecodinium cohnii, Strain Seligo" /LENGTH=424 /DNA_ID=CAMNT_0053886679 /DNA_START=132 /DNA_END=1406 /DNA_ORIENTATION=+
MGNVAGFASDPGSSPITIQVQCSHTGESISFSTFAGEKVTPNWSADQLKDAIQYYSGVPIACQKLLLRGQDLEASTTIFEAFEMNPSLLPGRGVCIYLYVNRLMFPMRLGPFETTTTPLKGEDFELPAASDDWWRYSFYWTLPNDTLTRFGLNTEKIKLKNLTEVGGQCSPLQKLTLREEDYERLNVPRAAVACAWSYQVSHWQSVDLDPYAATSETWQGDPASSSSVLAFLSTGGFLYFDEEHKVISVQGLRGHRGDYEAPAICFGGPQKWLAEWTLSLLAQGRFQRCTMQALRAEGARWYCWLPAGEILRGQNDSVFSEQPLIPHGGFVYLFHEDPSLTDPVLTAIDRYFPVTPGRPDIGPPAESVPQDDIYRALAAIGDAQSFASQAPFEDQPSVVDVTGYTTSSFTMFVPHSGEDKDGIR